MKPHLKQWRQRMLCGIFAWGLLFVVIFIYFTDSTPAEPAPSAFSFLETRRLLPVQGKHRAIMGALQEPSWPGSLGAHQGPLEGRPAALPRWAQAQGGLENDEEFFSSQIGRKSQSAFYPEDDDYLFAAGQPGLRGRAQGTPGGPSPGAPGRREGGAAGGPEPRRRARKRPRSAGGSRALEGGGGDGDRLYSSMSRAFLHRLWRGDVSSKMLAPRLQKAMQDYLSANKHGVRFRGRRAAGLSRAELLCALRRRVRVRTLDGREAPFAALGWQKLVPAVPLSRLHPRGLRSCAVVMSAGAILNSSLGEEIDSHDAVLRFNSAPTRGYEKDVGNKTTVRIINSQILTNPSHHFIDSSLYKDVILVAWDPAPYSANLNLWYKKPDYNLFTPYVQHRQRNPNQPFYILHPKFIWQLWDIIQENTKEKIQPNPPSSGFIEVALQLSGHRLDNLFSEWLNYKMAVRQRPQFLITWTSLGLLGSPYNMAAGFPTASNPGILIMMSMCSEVHVYEYIPSIRQTELCHYHELYYDAACTLGAYHPLLYEKLLVQRLNTGAQGDLHRKGKVVLPGLRAVRCPAPNPAGAPS